tara:strand:+ start:7025 stop:7720 length:696 start_codon:yes stop_codon:yes gene_type:complete
MTEKQLLAWSPAFLQEEGSGSKELAHTNKIILSEDILYEYKDDKEMFPLTFRIINPETLLSTVCAVHEFTALPGTCVIPYRIMEYLMLEQGSTVNLVYEAIPKGSYIKIRPHKTKFIELSNPKAVLERHININYPTLTKDETISILYNDEIYYIDIVETKPVESINILNSDINLDFDKPLDYVEPPKPEQKNEIVARRPVETRKKQVSSFAKEKGGIFVPFSGKGYTLGTK